MTSQAPNYRGYRFPPEIISHAVWLYHRFCLSFRDAEVIINMALSPEGGKVSRPTVYRTLNELVDAGLLRRMSLGGRAVYEHDYGYPQHDHLHCTMCDRLIEFQSAELRKLRDAVAQESNFRVTGHRLIISGICADCSRKRHRQQVPHDLI